MNQELRKEERIHRFLKGNFCENCGPFDPVGVRLMATIARWLWAINVRRSWPRSCGKCVTIMRPSGHDRVAIGSRSCRDVGPRLWATISLRLIPTSDDDRTAYSRSRVRWRSGAPEASTSLRVSRPIRHLKLLLVHMPRWKSRGLGSTRSTPLRLMGFNPMHLVPPRHLHLKD